MTEVRPSRLQNFPVSWFAVIMGMTGFTIAWHHAEILLALPVQPSLVLLGSTIIAFVILLALYLAKILRYPKQVKEEFSHPITLNFFPTVSIGLILMSIALLPYSTPVSLVCWAAGALMHLTFTLHVLSVWLHQTHFEVSHVNPAWFIPVVGNILVPIAGVEHASTEISWLQLTGDLNAFARILYYVAIFLTLMLLTQVKRFLRLEFFLSSWAYSFPMAAITIATFLMYEQLQMPFFKGLGVVLLVLLTLLISFLVWKTARAVQCRAVGIED